MRIQITNIKRNVSSDNLRKLFEEFGEIKSCDLVMDQETGESKGFGFVVFVDPRNTKVAVKKLNGYILNNQKIKVKSKKY